VFVPGAPHATQTPFRQTSFAAPQSLAVLHRQFDENAFELQKPPSGSLHTKRKLPPSGSQIWQPEPTPVGHVEQSAVHADISMQ
jgi:hypothetical protein